MSVQHVHWSVVAGPSVHVLFVVVVYLVVDASADGGVTLVGLVGKGQVSSAYFVALSAVRGYQVLSDY